MNDNVTSSTLTRLLPCLAWMTRYDRVTAVDDAVAAAIVTIMLIPQSLAYALLAGLPAEAGLYASIAPLLLYGLFGTSRTLAVGPVAVVSLMTAAAIGDLVQQGTPEYQAAAVVLALLSGLMLLAMGVLKLGFLANFLSHPVISGFIAASALLIAASQLAQILGVVAGGYNLVEMLLALAAALPDVHLPTLLIGGGTAAFLFWVRGRLKPWLSRRGVTARTADLAAKAGPVLGVAVTTMLTWGLALDQRGVRIVGDIPSGLPPLTMPSLDAGLWQQLAVAALLISVIGFVESVSVAQTLAAKRRERIVPDQELIGLGASNIGAAFSGGFPVTGGFARSVVNFDAGAATPAAGMITAIGILVAAMFLTPLLFFLPRATLAATILVAVISLIDLDALRRTWRYSRSDSAAMLATIALTLALGVEAGVVAGVTLSIALHLYRTSRPHWAVIGRVPGTQHYRNVERHAVVTSAPVLSIRVDESLYFPNARFLEDLVSDKVSMQPDIRHVVLQCAAVNYIDASALESLEAINERLADAGVTLHLSEVKGPVMDRLRRGSFIADLRGRVFLSHYDAMYALAPETVRDPRTNAPEGRQGLLDGDRIRATERLATDELNRV